MSKFSQEFIDGLKEIGIHQKLGLKILGEGIPLIKESFTQLLPELFYHGCLLVMS